MTNLMQKIEVTKKSMNKTYANTAHIVEIMNSSTDPFYIVLNGYAFGYMQGMKAAKAEMRKADKKENLIT